MKKNYFILIIFFVILSFVICGAAWAHQPRIVPDSQLTLVKNSEVSQAFYGELKGHEAYYLIDLKNEQDLYLQILVPDLPGILKDKSAAVEYLPELGAKAENFAKLDPAAVQWKKFYEEFAGDNYWQGPEVKRLAEPGYYVIKIFSPENQGKYVLVVGEQEEFPAGEMVKALITLPQLKKNFFAEPITAWFNGKIGRYFGLGLIIIIVFGFMFHRFNKVYK